ncbi:DUF6526 family protein [Bacillus sp. 2205SS5-2]|uniref:DUF6526 family protein n=1 Tax=Bacillus sp. 2205SS5-2 TaxID=3109031 RepID=UPI0030045385
MKKQNYQNHKKIDPVFHRVISLLALITLLLAVIFFVQTMGTELLLSLVILFIVFTLIVVGAKLRLYALQLQDRMIRTEENFRYYRMTGELLDANLTLKQVIALRFASDEEYPKLVERALIEKLSPDEIKKSVQNWRADHYRL